MELDPKAAALARFRFHADRAAHSFDSFLHNREADASPLIERSVFEPREYLKEP